MGHQTYTWNCKFCGRIHIWNRRYKFCNCMENNNQKNVAIKLVEKHLKYAHTMDDDYVFHDAQNDMHNAKKCALITVDVLQEYITKYDNHMKDYIFWQEVKQEINRL